MAEISKRPYKQVARAEARQRTRDALLDAAIEEFTQGRWEKASLQALANGAKVTKQTLLRHFGSKDGLLMQALASSAAETLEQRWSAHPGRRRRRGRERARPLRGVGRALAARRRVARRAASPSSRSLSQMARQVHYELGRVRIRPAAGASAAERARALPRRADRALRRAHMVAARARPGVRARRGAGDDDRRRSSVCSRMSGEDPRVHLPRARAPVPGRADRAGAATTRPRARAAHARLAGRTGARARHRRRADLRARAKRSSSTTTGRARCRRRAGAR